MKKNVWSSRLTFILATSGAAIGLGNIWRFPFISAGNGGGNFLLIYTLSLFIFGIPLAMNEMLIGRVGEEPSIVRNLKLLGKRFHFLSYLFILLNLVIMSYYIVVGGWAFFYLMNTVLGNIDYNAARDSAYYIQTLNDLFSNPWAVTFGSLAIIILTGLINIRGLNHGLERANNLILPLLFGLITIMVIRVLTLDGVEEGLKYYLTFDLSQLDSKTVMAALSQALFSLSLGLGTIIVYGAYLDKKVNIPEAALCVGALDSLVGVLAGLIVVPALFVFGYSVDTGPALIFLALPSVFSQLSFGGFFAAIFFFVMILAAISSTISMVELLTVFVMDKFQASRRTSVIAVCAIIFMLSIPEGLSFNLLASITWNGNNIFDITDYIAGNILVPLGVIFTCLYGGYALDKRAIDELRSDGLYRFSWAPMLVFALKGPIPVLLLWATLQGLGIF